MKTIKEIQTKAFWRNIEGFGYNHSDQKILWKSKSCAWQWLMIAWGIRNSDKHQWLPVWNMSNNSKRSLLFGFGFWFFQIIYHRRFGFKQKPFRRLVKFRFAWRLAQLFF